MKIKQYSVKKLFHTFDYDIQWTDDSSNILLLTGPNGYGKTTLLSILKYLFDGQLYYFYNLTFDKIEVTFDTNESIIVYKADPLKSIDIQSNILKDSEMPDEVLSMDNDVYFKVTTLKEQSILIKFTSEDARRLERQVYKSANSRYSSLSKLSSIEIINCIAQMRNPYNFMREREKEFGEYSMYITSLNNHFVPANRLNIKIDGQSTLSVFRIQNLLERTIKDAQISYLHKVADSRNHMIEKMISGDTRHTKQEYIDFVDKQREKVATLHEWGVLPFKEIIPYEEGKDMVYSVYLDELCATLPIYDALYTKLNLFSQLLEKKHFINKKILYSPQHGLQAITYEGINLDLDCLSSGEQNEICMYYDFIFNISKDYLLLIDEPENSLHIEWQSQFYDELQSICTANNIQAIVATHSPQIIGERWEQCFDLFEQIEEQNEKFNTKGI